MVGNTYIVLCDHMKNMKMVEKNNDVEMSTFLYILEILNSFCTHPLEGLLATFHSQKISQSELRLKNVTDDKFGKSSGCLRLLFYRANHTKPKQRSQSKDNRSTSH